MSHSEQQIEEKIRQKAEQLTTIMKESKPPVFQSWAAKDIIPWCINSQNLDRFIKFLDAYPSLEENEIGPYIVDRFGDLKDREDTPFLLRWGIRCAKISNFLTATLLKSGLRRNARHFIIGNDHRSASRTLKDLNRQRVEATVNILGEHAKNQKGAEQNRTAYKNLILFLKSLRDKGAIRQINISIKPSCVCLPDSAEAICEGFYDIVDLIIKEKGFLWIDMEEYQYKDNTLKAYQILKRRFPDYPWFGLALQTYLRDTDQDVKMLLSWAKHGNTLIAIRLVKGAYWKEEVIEAEKNGYVPPVYLQKTESDASFERNQRLILANYDICYLASATHNPRAIASAIALGEIFKAPKARHEIQMILGMASLEFMSHLLNKGQKVIYYSPFVDSALSDARNKDPLISGLAYLGRRFYEATDQTSVLRKLFMKR